MMAKWWPLLGLKPWMDHRLELGEPWRSEERRGVLAVSWCLCCARHEDGGSVCDMIGRRDEHLVRSGTCLGYIRFLGCKFRLIFGFIFVFWLRPFVRPCSLLFPSFFFANPICFPFLL
jgi:hypothetical protein